MIEQLPKEKLAKIIAREIFACGDQGSDKVQRIQFMGGIYPDHETNLGGLCETSLEAWILNLLEKHS